jgi:hypothetical protein
VKDAVERQADGEIGRRYGDLERARPVERRLDPLDRGQGRPESIETSDDRDAAIAHRDEDRARARARERGAERRAGLLELDHIDARDERIVCTTAATADEHEA